MKRLKRRLSVLLTAIAAIGLLAFSEQIKLGVTSGIKLCITSVIPSLYLFTVLSVFAVKAKIFENSRFFGFVFKIIYNLSANEGSVLFLSLICGYPVGAALIAEAQSGGSISSKRARTLMLSSVNAGPAFVITMVGSELYGSRTFGIVLFVLASVISVLTARLSGRFLLKNDCEIIKQHSAQQNEAEANYSKHFVSAVGSANSTMLYICGWVIIAASLMQVMPQNGALGVLKCLTEVTAGVIYSSKFSPYLTAFLVGFGGFCVHLQVLKSIKQAGGKYTVFFIVKTLQGALLAALTFLYLKIFPRTLETVAAQKLAASSGGTVFSAVSVIVFVLMTFVFCKCKKKEVENFSRM